MKRSTTEAVGVEPTLRISAAEGGGPARAKAHLDRALALSMNKKLGPRVSFAEGVLVQEQDRAAFTRALEEVVRADPGEVPRYTHIRYRALSLEGEAIAREAKGFHARVIQHECDHLDGVLYPMRMSDMSRFGFAEDIRRARPLAEDEETPS